MKLSITLLLLAHGVLIINAEYKKRYECVFPFNYNGKAYDDCITADAGAPWCSPTKEYTGLFYYCNNNQGDAIEKNGAFLSTQKKLLDNKKILDAGNFSVGDTCNNCEVNLQVIESSLSSLTKLSDDNERQITYLMDVENKNFKDFLVTNFEDIKEYLYCPSGWYSLDDDECFHFGPLLTLKDAIRYCHDKGGNVISINNEDENKLVLEKSAYILPKNSAFIIGMTDEQTEGKFRWTDESESTYTNWSANEPNNYGGNENCVMEYTSNGKWNDYNCQEKFFTVCRGQRLYLK